MTQKYDKHDEHATWIATRKTRRSAVRAAITRGSLHLILSLAVLVAVIWATVDFFQGFGWPAGAVPTAISFLILYSFVFPSARHHGPVLSLLYALEPAHRKKTARQSAAQSLSADLPDLDRIAADHAYAARIFRRRIRRSMLWSLVATALASPFAAFAFGRFTPAAGVEFVPITLSLFYVYARQKYSWTVAGFMSQNRDRAALVREEIGEKEGGDL